MNTPERIIVLEYIFHTGTEKERTVVVKLVSVFCMYFLFYELKICVVVIFPKLRAKLREHLCHHLDAHGLAL